jgi:DNA mismatch repair protein MutS
MQNVTPMMQRYLEIKATYPDCIVFYRLGDFYEMFFEDAKTVSASIGLTLTGRACGLAERAPMCGVPFHSVNIYVKKLVDLGFKIAIVEQLEEPNGKTLINRDVVRIITSGTVIDDAMLVDDKNNFIAAVYSGANDTKFYVAWADITTGELYVAEFNNLDDAFAQIQPKEIITNAKIAGLLAASDRYEYAFNTRAATETVKKYFSINSASVFDIPDDSRLLNAVGGLLEYLLVTQKNKLSNITKISKISGSKHLILDKTALDNLEIVLSYKENKKKGSLLYILDKTKTPMGARLLSSWVASPLRDADAINARADAVEELFINSVFNKDIIEILSGFTDIARFGGKVSNGNVTPRDLVSFTNSLESVKRLKSLVGRKAVSGLLKTTAEALSPLTELKEYLIRAIKPEPPAVMADGGYVNDGFNTELDELRNAGTLGKEWMLKLEAQERKETGIEKLRLAYNRVTGWYFEVPLNLATSVPFRFIRRGSTVSTERFTTAELREIENKIMGAAEKATTLETNIFRECCDVIKSKIDTIKTNAASVAAIDALASLSITAFRNEWVRPALNTNGELTLRDARHPVLEEIIPKGQFIANDARLDNDNTAMLITGPNMAGKSTYMKTVALNVILAHIGSFVPCASAVIPVTDRVFTRVGASDDMLTGKSTFMVEMNEVSNIIHNATKDSLLLLDEIGRGTGTTDGFALAKSILHYILEKIGAKTMFATHFHKLISVAREYPQIKNYKVLTRKIDGQIVFLHKVIAGEEQNSFGAEVAKLSGIPAEIIENAKQIIKDMEAEDTGAGRIGGGRDD